MVLPFHGPWENAVVITFTGLFSTKMINIGALQKVTITWHRFSTKNWKGHHMKEYQFVTKHIKRLSFKETPFYQEFNGYRILTTVLQEFKGYCFWNITTNLMVGIWRIKWFFLYTAIFVCKKAKFVYIKIIEKVTVLRIMYLTKYLKRNHLKE